MAKTPPCPERRIRTPSSVEDRCRRRVAFEDVAKRMLRYLEDSEDLKVSISEWKGQLETPEEEEGFSITHCPEGKE